MHGGRVDRRSRFRMVAVSLILVTVLAISAVAVAKTRTVKATSNDKWGPTHLYIGKGDLVVWKNPTSRTHDLKSTSKNWSYSKLLSPQKSAKRSFGKTGTFKYRCLRHSSLVGGVCRGMCGFVHVFAG